MKYLGLEITVTIAAFEEARKAGRRAARNKVKYDENPYIRASDRDLRGAWSMGHNEQRAALLSGKKYH